MQNYPVSYFRLSWSSCCIYCANLIKLTDCPLPYVWTFPGAIVVGWCSISGRLGPPKRAFCGQYFPHLILFEFPKLVLDLPYKVFYLLWCMCGVCFPLICVAQWEMRRTRNWSVRSSCIKGSHCFLEGETLPSLLSTGWLQEQIQAWLT